jgi:hypothetical protein
MKMPVRFSRGSVVYTGRIARAPYAAWAASPNGQSVLAEVAGRGRFTMFGKMRAARRLVRRQLIQAARADAVIVALQREIDEYLKRLDTFVYVQQLPRVAVDLRRLVVVPRLFVNAEAYHRITAAVRAQPAFTALEGGESLREWFVLTLIAGADAAIARARPSPQRPLPGGDGWIAVGVNEGFKWHVPFDGPAWSGHYYVLELRPFPMTRAIRNATRDAIAALEASLSSLPRPRCDEIVRQVGLSLREHVRA